MKSKELSRIIIGVILATALILGGTTWHFYTQAAQYKRHIENTNLRAFSDLLQSTNTIDMALQKIQYAGTGPVLSTLAAEIWRESESAKNAMSCLPTNDVYLEKFERFIAQTGDFSYAILRETAAGGEISTEYRDNLISLASVASQISTQVGQLKERIDAGDAFFGGITMSSGTGALITDDLSQSETDFPEYSSLIYDGPFSEHINSLTPKLTDNLEEISKEEALEKAKAFLMEGTPLSFQYEGEGIIPYYSFGDDKTTWVEVTRKGGYVLSLYNAREIGTATLTHEEAMEKARQYLASHGFENLKTSYYSKFEGIVTVNFAYTAGGVIIYPDLIQVGVALDDGSIVRFDAAGYVMNHYDRTMEDATVSPEQARQMVPSGLTQESISLAVIPTAGKHEALCYEFVCTTADGDHILIYVNAQTGLQENILILIESSNGILTR